MDKKTALITVVVGVLFAVSLVFFLNANDGADNTVQQQENESVQQPSQRLLVYEAVGTLEDVSSSGASGNATVEYYDDGAYELLVYSFMRLG
jgi:hypothetical protein